MIVCVSHFFSLFPTHVGVILDVDAIDFHDCTSDMLKKHFKCGIMPYMEANDYGT